MKPSGVPEVLDRNLAKIIIVRGSMICVAAILFWSGVEHLRNPFAFLSSILKYKLLTERPATFVASILPVFQTLLAGMMILGVARRFTSFCAAGLLSVFSVAQASALARGLEIGCGCFGAASNAPITLSSVGRVASLAVLAWLMLRFEVEDAPADPVPNVAADEIHCANRNTGATKWETCP